MIRSLLVLTLGIATGVGGLAAVNHHEDGESVKTIAARNIEEKLDGKDAKVTVVEVTIEPGQSGSPHRHPGPGFVYVVEGAKEVAIPEHDNE